MSGGGQCGGAATRTHEQMEAKLHDLGWRITAGPSRTFSGWKATMQHGSSSILMTGRTKLGVLEDMLRHGQKRTGG